MDTHRLKYFLRIADEGSMTRAATVLGIAQPALSRQIHRLEEELGVVLFHRTSRGMELTEEGEQLRASTAAPLRQLELAVQYAGSPLARLERGFRLGLLETTVDLLAKPLLGSLASAFPKMSFDITVANTDLLIESLLKGTLDTAIINPVPDDRLFSSDLLIEGLVVMGGATSDLTPDRSMRFIDIAELPLVMPSTPTGLASTIENAALRLQIQLQSRFATDSLQVAKSLIQAGTAYGILPMSACTAEIESGRIRWAPLTEPAVSQKLIMASTGRLELPRGLAIRIGNIIHDEIAQLIHSGSWPAQILHSRHTHETKGRSGV